MPRIFLQDASVEFPIYDVGERSLRRTLLTMNIGGSVLRRDRKSMVVSALADVTLDIREGDSLGLIGPNGAGKSTLLRVLAGLYYPTRGHVLIEGKVAPLLNLHAALDPEMSGYENIDHAAVLLRVPRHQHQALIEDVADFTELGVFLDLPVKSYSAGMQLRLAFALMTFQQPDILLVDEVVGVGDTVFLAKAAQRMKDLRNKASISVVSSHNDDHIRRLCNKVVWLERGRIMRAGPVDEVLAAYAEGQLNRPPPETP